MREIFNTVTNCLPDLEDMLPKKCLSSNVFLMIDVTNVINDVLIKMIITTYKATKQVHAVVPIMVDITNIHSHEG